MKIIFLDIDGVLNWRGTDRRHDVDGFIGLDPANVAAFNRVVAAHPDAKIVISSSWRHCSPFQKAYQDFEGLKKVLYSRGLNGDIIGHTPIFFSHRARGDEIRAWLTEFRETHKDPFEYVVLDDDREGMAPYVRYGCKYGWETDEERAERLAEPLEEDLRLRHVVTSFNGYVTHTMYGGTELGEPGGLRDQDADLAIRILNGTLNDVSPPKEDE